MQHDPSLLSVAATAHQIPVPSTLLVLGASGGIGAVLSRRLRAQGHHLLLAAPASDRLHSLAAELDAPALSIDATLEDDVQFAVQHTVDTFGQISGAVNLVGSVLLKPAHRTTDDDWRRTLALNLDTAFHLVRACVQPMRAEGGGSIVLLSTAASTLGLANQEAIAAAKGGVTALARSAAASYAPWGVRVNCVAPGLIQTASTRHITSSVPARTASLNMQALRRLGQPEDVANAIAFLLDPASNWITGQVLGVDGGLASTKAPR